eukprot:NODE_244_length_1097_cov_422.720619_g237_i0.p1 GENE.NODE_244_length_1097_cov_422.720619_g237_i0~~NODE_244_length_1097_cov_422.720619_g237_i0.p1  ORF type:complete len:272 (-),score=67.08 NODE_244_length_1097_cov_422.720619_g237_i0:215-1030(-)
MAGTLRLLLWGLLALCLLTTTILAQEDGDEEEGTEEASEGEGSAELNNEDDSDLEPTQKAADGVLVTAILPNNRDSKLPAGSTVEALIGFENENDENTFSVEYIRGFLTSPQDSTYFAQNFSGQLFNTTVESGVEASLLYEFRPDAAMDPRDWVLLVEVFYADADNVTYLQTAFNATISITDPESNWDAKSLFAFLAIAGLVSFGGYMGSKMMKKGGGGRSRGVKSAAPGPQDTGTGGVEWEFVDPKHISFLNKGVPSPSKQKKGSDKKKN